ncbi:YaiO family outer membrane beta-barrel protein [uncultured Maribacter sp.]|uniref:YaiO family outer membrane beta-barrel protein n=1 Tax=uncultured Maribacter sp. TaxID=431308 RepID=UPI0030ED08EA|tara:strand:+ start:5394 stop:6722 length:1329 start_codon:yes stop_codon:yes gene_type:complete
MKNKIIQCVLFLLLICVYSVSGQDINTIENKAPSFEKAYELAYDGKTSTANRMLSTLATKSPDDTNSKLLWASTNSWEGNYEKARVQFNDLLSNDKSNRSAWLSAIKNELYAKNYYIALGLSNKALIHIKKDIEIERLRTLALNGVNTVEYDDYNWSDSNDNLNKLENKEDVKNNIAEELAIDSSKTNIVDKSIESTEEFKKSVTFNSSLSVFNEVFDPMSYASISYKQETALGSIIPRINYSNRFGINGVQYDLDLYPKITKGLYAYVNYGYSNSEIYPNHRVGGDLYLNIKGGLEFSAGGRFISFTNTDVSLITNSIGYYTGNYYFSLRSYITPSKDNLTSLSGNILVRKYLKGAKNYFGVNVGVGYSPELRQLTSQSQILAETLLYLESQRLSLEYQFPSKNDMSTYSTSIGITREELSFSPGSFFWSLSAGLTYSVKF